MNLSRQYNNGVFAPGSTSYQWWLLVIAMLGTFMAVLDVTIVNVALPTIIAQYHGTIAQGEWIATAYLLANVLVLPVAGWMSMRFGFKRILLLGVAIFTLGSLWCSISWSMDALIIGRFVEGLGSGAILPVSMALITREFPIEKRPLALGFWAMAAATSVSLGPMSGGYIVNDFQWDVIFLVNIPIGVVTMAAIWFIVREQKSDKVMKFDTLGLLYLWIWLPLVLILLGQADQWPIGVIFAVGACAILFFILFVRHSLRSPSAMVDIRLLKNRNFGISMIVMTLYGIGLYAGNYLLPLYVEHTLGYTAWQAGVIFLPVGIIQGTTAPLSGWFSRFVGNKALLISGMIVFASYLGVSTLFDANTPHWIIMLSLYLRGLGIGLSFTALNTLSLSEIANDDMASASSISNTIRQFSGSIGIAILSVVLSGHTGSTYVSGIHKDFVIIFIIASLALVPTFLLRNKK